MLFQQLLKSSYGSQAVNGVYMHLNTQCKNVNQGQGSRVTQDYRYMRQLSKRNFSSCSQNQYQLRQQNSNFFEVKQKDHKVNRS